jgi:SAM-dependent methyltransferase
MQQLAHSIDTAPVQPDIATIRAKMKATWEDGDYAGFARYMENGAIEILENWQIPPGQRLLDIGCGAGQSAIPAARLGHRVTGVDIAENLIEHARERARFEGLNAHFKVGDAEDLPCADHSFDVVVSMIGAMFAPHPNQVATELARVTRPGGRLYMANWTPTSMPARMFKCISSYVPPPPGFVPPPLWGDEETVRNRLAHGFTDIQLKRRLYPQWHYPFSVAELVGLFRSHFGPVKGAFEALDEEGQESLQRDLEQIYTHYSESHDGHITIRGEYLEVIATRR